MWQSHPMGMRERIKATIEAKAGMSIRSVSLAAGLSDSLLSKFLKGDNDSMTIKTAEKLAAALEVDPIWLIFGEGDPDQAADLSALFRRIPSENQEQARRVLETFLRTGTDG